jgi:hypothetical protein
MGMTDPKAERAQPAEELVAITKAYDLVREMTQRVGKFPRDFKFLLGDRILSNFYDVHQIRSTRGSEIGSGGTGASHGKK